MLASIGAQQNDLRSYPRVIDGKNSDQSEYRTSGPMKMVLSNEPMKMTGIIEPMKMNIGKNRKKEKSILRSVPIKTASKAKNGIKGNHKGVFFIVHINPFLGYLWLEENFCVNQKFSMVDFLYFLSHLVVQMSGLM